MTINEAIEELRLLGRSSYNKWDEAKVRDILESVAMQGIERSWPTGAAGAYNVCECGHATIDHQRFSDHDECTVGECGCDKIQPAGAAGEQRDRECLIASGAHQDGFENGWRECLKAHPEIPVKPPAGAAGECTCGNIGPEEGIPSPLCPVHKDAWTPAGAAGEHKAGCPAQAGYGHDPEPCICGAGAAGEWTKWPGQWTARTVQELGLYGNGNTAIANAHNAAVAAAYKKGAEDEYEKLRKAGCLDIKVE